MTTEERLEKVEQELAAAKRRNRWILGCGALLILCCLTIVATSGNKRTIRANQFILEDANGQTRAVMTMAVNEDEPLLAMYDANRKPRVMMALGGLGPGLQIMDANGEIRAGLGLDKVGPALVIRDASGKDRVGLSVDKDGPGLQMMDASGKTRVMMRVIKDGLGLQMLDENEKPIWTAP